MSCWESLKNKLAISSGFKRRYPWTAFLFHLVHPMAIYFWLVLLLPKLGSWETPRGALEIGNYGEAAFLACCLLFVCIFGGYSRFVRAKSLDAIGKDGWAPPKASAFSKQATCLNWAIFVFALLVGFFLWVYQMAKTHNGWDDDPHGRYLERERRRCFFALLAFSLPILNGPVTTYILSRARTAMASAGVKAEHRGAITALAAMGDLIITPEVAEKGLCAAICSKTDDHDHHQGVTIHKPATAYAALETLQDLKKARHSNNKKTCTVGVMICGDELVRSVNIKLYGSNKKAQADLFLITGAAAGQPPSGSYPAARDTTKNGEKLPAKNKSCNEKIIEIQNLHGTCSDLVPEKADFKFQISSPSLSQTSNNNSHSAAPVTPKGENMVAKAPYWNPYYSGKYSLTSNCCRRRCKVADDVPVIELQTDHSLNIMYDPVIAMGSAREAVFSLRRYFLFRAMTMFFTVLFFVVANILMDSPRSYAPDSVQQQMEELHWFSNRTDIVTTTGALQF